MTKITFVGHSTLLIEMDNLRILTDPLVRKYIGHLRRQVPIPDSNITEADTILISHMHGDHFDVRSLLKLGMDKRIIVPKGAGPYLRLKRFSHVEELSEGESIDIEGVRVTAAPAAHPGRRLPWKPLVQELSYVIDGSDEIFFAGDTDIFDDMANIGQEIDVALLPVWGWGPTLGPGHMDPERAAQSLLHLNPKLAIPIHWGTYCPVIMDWFKPRFLSQPPLDFVNHSAEIAPEIRVKVINPGDTLDVGELIQA